jgi:hypothetical protein
MALIDEQENEKNGTNDYGRKSRSRFPRVDCTADADTNEEESKAGDPQESAYI